MSNRATAVFEDRMKGGTLRAVGERHGLTAEGARLMIIREGRRQIDSLEMRLLANRATGAVEAFIVPDHSGLDFDLAMAYFQWAMSELAKRGVVVKVDYRPAHNGLVLAVTDVTNYGSPKETTT